jgi:heme/copper-type cytochrome/quinol oxidase subunit 2
MQDLIYGVIFLVIGIFLLVISIRYRLKKQQSDKYELHYNKMIFYASIVAILIAFFSRIDIFQIDYFASIMALETSKAFLYLSQTAY